VIGYMANNLLPARLGEIVRAYVTGKREQMSRSSVFASVVLERLFDGLTIIMILILLMFVTEVDRPWLRIMAWTGLALFTSGLAFLFGLAYQKDRVLRLTEKVVSILPQTIAEKILHILRKFVSGLQLLHSPRDFLISISSSFLVWGCEVMVYIVYLKAFQIDAPITAALLALVVDLALDPLASVYNWWIWVPCLPDVTTIGPGVVEAYNFEPGRFMQTPANWFADFFGGFFPDGNRYPTRVLGIPLINFIAWFVFVFVFTLEFRYVESRQRWTDLKKTAVLWGLILLDVPVLAFILITPNI